MCVFGIGIKHINHCPGRFLNIISQNPSVSKSNWLHVVIFQYFVIDLGIYSIDSSTMTGGNFPKVLNFNRLFLNSTGSSVTSSWFSPFIDFNCLI